MDRVEICHEPGSENKWGNQDSSLGLSATLKGKVMISVVTLILFLIIFNEFLKIKVVFL